MLLGLGLVRPAAFAAQRRLDQPVARRDTARRQHGLDEHQGGDAFWYSRCHLGGGRATQGCPHSTIGPGGSCSMKATVSSANSDQWYGGSGLEESPWPRRSTAMPVARPASSPGYRAPDPAAEGSAMQENNRRRPAACRCTGHLSGQFDSGREADRRKLLPGHLRHAGSAQGRSGTHQPIRNIDLESRQQCSHRATAWIRVESWLQNHRP